MADGGAVAEVQHARWIVLNHLLSTSISRGRHEHKPPIHGIEELLDILRHRIQNGTAIEVFDSEASDDKDDAIRIAGGKTHNFIRLISIDKIVVGKNRYAVLLIDAVDHALRGMPVLDVVSLQGRDIVGSENERGSFSTHVVIKLPGEGDYDDGRYRCAIEASSGIPRRHIEAVLNRQIRRYSRITPFEYEVVTPRVRKPKRQTLKYRPKILLASDVGRSMFGAKRDVSHMLFTKRSERQDISNPTQVVHEDVEADIDLKVSAKQGPIDPEERRSWVQRVISYYEGLGFTTKLYFRQIGGKQLGGAIGASEDGAADLILCPKEAIYTSSEPKKWVGVVAAEVRDEMIKILERDELWERTTVPV